MAKMTPVLFIICHVLVVRPQTSYHSIVPTYTGKAMTTYLRSNGPKTTQNEQKRGIFAPNGASKIHSFCSVFVIFGPFDLK